MDSNHLMTYWEREEDENSKKGLIGSICFHTILLLVFLLPWFKTVDPPPGLPGVLVSMGNPDFVSAEDPSPKQSSEPIVYRNEEELQEETDSATDVEVESKPIEEADELKPKEAPPIEIIEPTKEVPAKFEKTVINTQQESPIAIKEDNKKQTEEIKEQERKQAELELRAKEKLQEQQDAQAAKAAQKAAEKKAEAIKAAKRKRAEEAERKRLEEQRKKQEAYEKTKNELGSLFGGEGNDNESEGKKGQPDGNSDSKILEGLSGGLGEVGGGLSGRGIIYEPKIKENSQKTGKVVVKVCVDQSGTVISSKFTQRGSTTTDTELVDVAQKAAAKYKFTPGELVEQCGTITIDFKLK